MNVRHVLDELHDRRASPSPRVFLHLVRRPSSWWVAATGAIRFAPSRWWLRTPFLPIPDSRYWRFRMETAYGDTEAVPDLEDLVTAMRWSQRACRRRR